MRLILAAASTSILVLAAACGASGQNARTDAPVAAGAPIETRPANGADQTPAFAGQTRAPGVTSTVRMAHRVVASGLVHPWGLALLPDGRWLVTERPGRLRIITAEGRMGEPVAGVLAVDLKDGMAWVRGLSEYGAETTGVPQNIGTDLGDFYLTVRYTKAGATAMEYVVSQQLVEQLKTMIPQ